jgi:predicted ATPase
MPLIKNKKIVISGGPGSGKTTLVNLLRDKGYKCFDEYSRILIQSAQKKGENNIFKSHPLFFSEEVWKGREEQYKKYGPSLGKAQKPYVFFDRGLHDVVAYLEYIGAPYDSQKFDLSNYTYDMALLLPPWKAIYIKDNERKEDFEEAEKLYFYIKNTYQKNNIPIVEIPIQTPEVRISTLLEYLDHGKNA